MMWPGRWLCGAVFCLMLWCALPVVAAEDPTPHSTAELFADVTSIHPGTPFTVALRLRMDAGWHTYWQNAGDSGTPVMLEWKLPAGFTASDIQWPYPHKIETPPLVTYGYENEVVLLTTITPPANLAPGKTVALTAQADWLICRELCLPAAQVVAVSLPVRAEAPQADARRSDVFSAARSRLPVSLDGWETRAEPAADGVTLRVVPPRGQSAPADGTQFFPSDTATLNHATPQTWRRDGDGASVALKKSDYATGPIQRLRGVLVAREGQTWDREGRVRALAVDVPVTAATAAGAASTGTNSGRSAAPGAPGVWLSVLLAFVGGILLNLMPCVFPVLSLKVLSFVRQAGEERRTARAHGLAFGLGVVLSFWALAGVLLLVRAGGKASGWGFQLQSPAFVAGMALLLFAVGLNLMGVFEMGVSVAAVGGRVNTGAGLAGAFSSGMLATLIATPCTAPFMGTALGFALAQPVAVAFLVFTALGVGMALPYVLLSFSPGLMRFLPRPGAWMETLRQALAFPMFATVVWLLWVFGLQTGVDGMARLLGALLLMTLGAWVLGRWGGVQHAGRARRAAWLGAAGALAAAVSVGISGARAVPPNARAAASQDAWEAFSEARVRQIQAEGRPVFIDFTAAWCVTCQVNKRTTLNTDVVQKAFRDRNVALLRADWTARDAEIGRALQSYGRSGVPAYVLHPGGDAPPVLLPEVLTRQVVLDALDRLPRAPDAP